MLSPLIRRLGPALVAVASLAAGPAAVRAQAHDLAAISRQAAELACGKRVVILGELPSHGEAGAFAVKAGIVEELISRCGFRTILFEAPAYEFVGLERGIASGTATSLQLDRAMGRFWWTRELESWKAWLFGKAAAGEVSLGGLDDQLSATSDYARANLPHLLRDHLRATAAEDCERAVDRYLNWRYDSSAPFDHAERLRLRGCARGAADSIARVAGARQSSREQLMLDNLAGYFARQADSSTGVPRDEAMYRNYRWHVERAPTDTKVIIWTSTVHAARRHGEPLRRRPLGAWLHDEVADGLFVMGFSAFAGQSSMAGAAPRVLADAPPASLEARVTSPDTPASLVTAAELQRIGPALTRVFGPFAVADLSAMFDAVIVIRTEVAPTPAFPR